MAQSIENLLIDLQNKYVTDPFTALDLLQKSAIAGDATARMVLEHPITNLLIKNIYPAADVIAQYIRLDVQFNENSIIKDGKRRLIAGYASVEVIDKQGELVTIPALQKAWAKMVAAGELYASLNLEHSNIRVGTILLTEKYTDSQGVEHYSHIDDRGLYVLCEIRSDLEIANKVWAMACQGQLNCFSIGGRCLSRRPNLRSAAGAFLQIDDLELYEITICRRGANRLSGFEVLKGYREAGLIDEETFLAKSESMRKSDLIAKELAILPGIIGKTFVLRENFISQVDSLDKSDKHAVELLVKMDGDNPLRRQIQTQVSKAVAAEFWPDIGYVYGPEAEAFANSKPLFNLALVPATGVAKGMSKSPVDLSKVPPEDIVKEVLRIAIIAEYDAVSLYEQLKAAVADQPEVQQVLASVLQEEQVHIGEFQSKLYQLDPTYGHGLSRGAEEQANATAKSEGTYKCRICGEPAASEPDGLCNACKNKQAAESQSTATVESTSDNAVDGTLKNVVQESTPSQEEDKQMSKPSEEVKKGGNLVGLGTGPQEGAVTGTSTTGPAIASRKTRLAKMEEMLKKAGVDPSTITDDPPEEKAEPPAPAEAPAEKAFPAPAAAPAAPAAEKAFPPAAEEKSVDEATLKSLLDLDAAGKLPAEMHNMVAKMAEKANITKADLRVAKLEKTIETLTSTVGDLANIVKNIKVPSPVEVATILKNDGEIIRKTAATGTLGYGPAEVSAQPAGAAGQGAKYPTTLADMRGMSFEQINQLNERRNQAMRQGAAF